MNQSSLLAAACFGALITSAAAFSLDAVGYEGGLLEPNPGSILVPGYGEVVFETGIGTPLVVQPAYGNGNGFSDFPVRFVDGDAVRLTEVSVRNADVGESFHDLPESSGPWQAIPEPATAGLGLVGLLILAMGRYR